MSSKTRIALVMCGGLVATNATAGPAATPGRADECAGDCPKQSTRWADRKQSDFLTSGAKLSVGGIRGSSLLVLGSDAAGRSGGVMLANRSEAYAQNGWLTVHRLEYSGIGWGSGGIEAEVGGSMEGGVRLPAGQHHGPFLRAGVEGYAGGNRRLYSSFLELPRAQIGYQILTRTLLLEAAAHLGANLLGRYSAGERATRHMNLSLSSGGHVALHRAPIRLDVSVKRVEAGGVRLGRPVYVLRAAACSYAGRFALCTDLRYLRGDLRGPDARPFPGATAIYAGLMAGLASTRL